MIRHNKVEKNQGHNFETSRIDSIKYIYELKDSLIPLDKNFKPYNFKSLLNLTIIKLDTCFHDLQNPVG